VAEALYYTWEQEGMIHRDVKPENIIITDAGVIKLTDMGLAMKTQEWSEDMEISGSPSYMSPEQFAGEPLDSQTDIYSLGITLYQMLSGELPFDGRTVRTVAKQHFSEVAISLSKKDSHIPQSVAKLVKKMIAKEKEDRIKSIEALLDRIWKIRQETAPNKSLVPDVHTISIKRLDYDIQKDSMEKKRQEKRKKIEALRESNKFKFSVYVIPAVILITFIVLLFTFRKDKETEEFKTHKEFFISKVDKGELSFSALEAEGRELLERYKGIKSDDGQKYLTEVRMALTQISNMRLSKKLERMEFRSNQLRVSLSAEKRKLENMVNAKRAPKVSNTVNKKLLAKLKQQQEEMKRLKKKVGVLAKQTKNLSKEKSHLIKKNNNNWKQNIGNKLFKILTTPKKGLRFFKANNLLDHELSIKTSKESITWLKNKKQLIATLKKINSLFDKKLVGVNLPGNRRIDMVFVAEKKLKINSKEIEWSKLKYKDMEFLVKKFKIKVNPDTFKQNVLFLQGKIVDAIEEGTDDYALSDIIMSHYQKSLETIKFNNLLNPRKSDKQVKQLLKSLNKVKKHSGLLEIKKQLELILDK
jgi:serine/threonine protein kinase